MKPREGLTLEAGGKDFVQKHVIPYIQGHELLVVHDMVKWIAESIIHRKFWHKEPFWGLIVDDTRTKRCGEHVIQPPANRA